MKTNEHTAKQEKEAKSNARDKWCAPNSCTHIKLVTKNKQIHIEMTALSNRKIVFRFCPTNVHGKTFRFGMYCTCSCGCTPMDIWIYIDVMTVGLRRKIRV